MQAELDAYKTAEGRLKERLRDKDAQVRCRKRGYHLSLITYHLSPITYHLSPITYHLSPITYHLSPITYHLSLITYHLSPITYHAPRIRLLYKTYHLSRTTYQVFHMSPAPVQVLPGVSYFGTMGGQAMDQYISDRIGTPPEIACSQGYPKP